MTQDIEDIPDLHAKALNYVFENSLVLAGGMWLEFGVHGGGSINRIAKYTDKIIYGFDSFEGLPEAWNRKEVNGVTYPPGAFSLGGQLPEVAPNVKLIKGWYKNTLPYFLKTRGDELITFIHIDSDIYSSAKDILDNVASLLSPGCIIVFDELVGYDGYKDNEWKAWWEFVETNDVEFQWIGGNVSGRINEVANLRFDNGRLPGENVSPSRENVALVFRKCGRATIADASRILTAG